MNKPSNTFLTKTIQTKTSQSISKFNVVVVVAILILHGVGVVFLFNQMVTSKRDQPLIETKPINIQLVTLPDQAQYQQQYQNIDENPDLNAVNAPRQERIINSSAPNEANYQTQSQRPQVKQNVTNKSEPNQPTVSHNRLKPNPVVNNRTDIKKPEITHLNVTKPTPTVNPQSITPNISSNPNSKPSSNVTSIMNNPTLKPIQSGNPSSLNKGEESKANEGSQGKPASNETSSKGNLNQQGSSSGAINAETGQGQSTLSTVKPVSPPKPNPKPKPKPTTPIRLTVSTADWLIKPSFEPNQDTANKAKRDKYSLELSFRVDKNGNIHMVDEYKSSGDSRLDRDMKNKLKTGKLKPFIYDGEAIERDVILEIKVKLK